MGFREYVNSAMDTVSETVVCVFDFCVGQYKKNIHYK